MKHHSFNNHGTATKARLPEQFRKDVAEGLGRKEKQLDSRYFYDAEGDRLFQEIMRCPEYYLTSCELQIICNRKEEIIDKCAAMHAQFDIVELGAGDASKSVHLIKAAVGKGCCNTYYPIDISHHIITYLEAYIPENIKGIQVYGMAGAYFDMLDEINVHAARPKLILFLGATIGNMAPPDALDFCKQLRRLMKKGDMLLIGFDLKKNPWQILNAYNDRAGITRAFNLNLLKRINRELGADFDTEKFVHFPVYDPVTGACKSYLVSTEAQVVTMKGGYRFSFEKDEPVFMEISQKYTAQEIRDMALESGFRPIRGFTDHKGWFTDSLWIK